MGILRTTGSESVIPIDGCIVVDDDKWIYELLGIQSVCPNDVREALAKLNGESKVVVEIDSYGGSVDAGSNIYTQLRSANVETEVRIVGLAASAASVIAMAGSNILMSPTAMMMMHNAWSEATGDYNDMQRSSDMLRETNRAIAAAYVQKSGMSEEEVLDMMEKETWLSAKSAIDLRLADGIMFDEEGDRESIETIAQNREKAMYARTLNMRNAVALIRSGNCAALFADKKPETEHVNDEDVALAEARIRLEKSRY